MKLKAHLRASRERWRGPVTVVWYQGGLKPDAEEYIDIENIANGAIFEGTKGSHPRRLHHARRSSPTTTTAISLITSGATRQHLLAAGERERAADAERRAPAPSSAMPRPRRRRCRRASRRAPNAQARPNGFAAVQFLDERPARRRWDCRIPTSRRFWKRRRAATSTATAGHLPDRVDRGLQGQVQRRDARHQQQDALRLRLLRHR